MSDDSPKAILAAIDRLEKVFKEHLETQKAQIEALNRNSQELQDLREALKK